MNCKTFTEWWVHVEGWKTEGGSGEAKARAAWNAAQKDLEAENVRLTNLVEYWQKEANQLTVRLAHLADLPLCRRQLPDGSVPCNTEEALEKWVAEADRLSLLLLGEVHIEQPYEPAPQKVANNTSGLSAEEYTAFTGKMSYPAGFQ